MSSVLQVRSQKGLYLRGGADRTGDPILTEAVFHAVHVILSLKLWDHEGLALLHPWSASEEDPACCSTCDPDPDSDPCIPKSSSHLLPRPVRESLVLPGSCWQDAGDPAPNSGKLSIRFVYFVLFLLL